MSGFNATPVDGSTPAIPMSSVVSPNDKTPHALQGGPAAAADTQGNVLAPASMYTYDGNNETLGAKANAAVTDATQTATEMSFVKGIVKILADVWDSTNHWLQVKVMNQITKATLYTVAAGTVTSGSTQNSGDLDVSKTQRVSIDVTTTAQAGTNPTIQYFWERKGVDGIYYPLWQSDILTVAANTKSTSVGPGSAYPLTLGTNGRLRWVVGGTSTPTFTHSISVIGE